MPKVYRGVEFPDDATPEEVVEFFSAESTAAATPGVGPGGEFVPPIGPAPEEPGLEEPWLSPADALPFTPVARIARLTGAAGGMMGRGMRSAMGFRPPSAMPKKAASAAKPMLGSVMDRVAKFALKRGTAKLRGYGELAGDVGDLVGIPGRAAKAAPKAAAKQAAPAAKTAQRKPNRPKRTKKAAEQPKLGSAESRIKKPAPAKAGSVASRVRTTEPRARAAGKRPAEFAMTDTHSMEDMLRLSVGLEDEMAARGLSEAEKALLRQEARRLVSGLP